MKRTERCLLCRLLGGEYRAVVYAVEKKLNGPYARMVTHHHRYVIDFSGQTLLEVLHYLEAMFCMAKETVEMF